MESILFRRISRLILLRFETASVSSVRLAPNLSRADIYILGRTEEETDSMVKTLNKERRFFTGSVAGELGFRRVPHLYFNIDNTASRRREVGDALALIDRELKNKNEDSENEESE